MAKNEKNWNRKYGKILEEAGISSIIIPDSYIIAGGNMATAKKPYDRIVTVAGFACEFKYQSGGKTFNVKSWREKQPHQIKSLLEFDESGCGYGVLMIFWKQKGKRNIDIRFLYAWECVEIDKIAFEDMHDEQELRENMILWKKANQEILRTMKKAQKIKNDPT